MWRVRVGLHKSITYSFLPVGHTKFGPDWCFGLLKQKYRYTAVNSLDDIVQLTESSSVANTSQLVGEQDGSVVVPFYNWQGFLSPHYNRLNGIKSNQHFKITAPGVVEARIESDSNPKLFNLQKDGNWNATALPEQIIPPGLSNKRQWYLYDKIRQFCSEESKDLVCPLPSVTREQSVPPDNIPPLVSLQESSPASSPIRKRRNCGNCGMQGHNRRSCTQ